MLQYTRKYSYRLWCVCLLHFSLTTYTAHCRPFWIDIRRSGVESNVSQEAPMHSRNLKRSTDCIVSYRIVSYRIVLSCVVLFDDRRKGMVRERYTNLTGKDGSYLYSLIAVGYPIATIRSKRSSKVIDSYSGDWYTKS